MLALIETIVKNKSIDLLGDMSVPFNVNDSGSATT